MASEGFDGGYAAALDDVLLYANSGYVPTRWRASGNSKIAKAVFDSDQKVPVIMGKHVVRVSKKNAKGLKKFHSQDEKNLE